MLVFTAVLSQDIGKAMMFFVNNRTACHSKQFPFNLLMMFPFKKIWPLCAELKKKSNAKYFIVQI